MPVRNDVIYKVYNSGFKTFQKINMVISALSKQIKHCVLRLTNCAVQSGTTVFLTLFCMRWDFSAPMTQKDGEDRETSFSLTAYPSPPR